MNQQDKQSETLQWAPPPGGSVLRVTRPPPRGAAIKESGHYHECAAHRKSSSSCRLRTSPVAGPAVQGWRSTELPQSVSTNCRGRPGISAILFSPAALTHGSSHRPRGRPIRRRLQAPSPLSTMLSRALTSAADLQRRCLPTTEQARRAAGPATALTPNDLSSLEDGRASLGGSSASLLPSLY